MPNTLAPVPDGSEPTPEELAEMEIVQRERRKAALDERAPPLGRGLRDTLDRLRGRGAGLPIVTPWPTLNRILGRGFWPGMHVLTGTTGSGKTQFALQVALSAAEAQIPAVYIGLELNRDEITARVLSLLAGREQPHPVMWSDIYFGVQPALNRIEETGAARRLAELHRLRFEEAEGGRWTADALPEMLEEVRARYAADVSPLFVLDYLQIVGSPPGAREDLRERIRNAAIGARNVARRGATVLLLSSVSRAGASQLVPSAGAEKDDEPFGQGDPSRFVGLGKESGEIEFSADTVLALGRTEEHREGGTPMHLAAAKVRAGRPGWVRLSFNGSWFSEQTIERVC